MLGLSDTICAPATVPGTGALTVIRVSGPQALAVVDRIFEGQRPLRKAAGNTVLHGAIVEPEGGCPDRDSTVQGPEKTDRRGRKDTSLLHTEPLIKSCCTFLQAAFCAPLK